MPIHQDLWDHWKQNKETDPIKRAIRFLFLSNYGFLGKPNTLRFNNGNTSKILYENIARTNEFIFGCEFMNCDFREIFKKVSFKSERERQNTFIYCDPPYLETANNYTQGFTEKDCSDLFDVLQSSGVLFAYSEFDHPMILEQAKAHNLELIIIGERKNIGNRRTEVLVTNYNTSQLSLF